MNLKYIEEARRQVDAGMIAYNCTCFEENTIIFKNVHGQYVLFHSGNQAFSEWDWDRDVQAVYDNPDFDLTKDLGGISDLNNEHWLFFERENIDYFMLTNFQTYECTIMTDEVFSVSVVKGSSQKLSTKNVDLNLGLYRIYPY